MSRGILALAALVLLSTAVFAHSQIEKTTPAHGATVATVAVIEILFDDPMRVTAIALKEPRGDMEIIRETGLEPVTKFRAQPLKMIPEGIYRVAWRGLSSDGHPMQGSFSFTIAE